MRRPIAMACTQALKPEIEPRFFAVASIDGELLGEVPESDAGSIRVPANHDRREERPAAIVLEQVHLTEHRGEGCPVWLKIEKPVPAQLVAKVAVEGALLRASDLLEPTGEVLTRGEPKLLR